MKIYTSYFAKYKNGINAVSIARGTPKWFNGKSIIEFAPPRYMINYSPEDYKKEFKKVVIEKTAKNGLNKLQEGDVLLCYEKPNEFCHRHIIAEWLRGLGYDVQEIGYQEQKQETLF
jgi:hypothetical protein